MPFDFAGSFGHTTRAGLADDPGSHLDRECTPGDPVPPRRAIIADTAKDFAGRIRVLSRASLRLGLRLRTANWDRFRTPAHLHRFTYYGSEPCNAQQKQAASNGKGSEKGMGGFEGSAGDVRADDARQIPGEIL